MNVIDTRRWQRASRLLDQALDLPHHQLDTWLGELRVSDPDGAADVEALLLEHRQLNDEGFLDGGMPSIDVPLAGVTLGGYTLVSPIDQGGMGSVWLAERSDGRFEGRAAVKLLNASLLGREGEARFRREGTVLARLTHAHIARLVDAGVSRAGQPYLVLEYVDGQHIDRFCDDQRLGIEDRIRLFLDVQAAVAHAHANLIVHRDLKPSNVLVTGDGQVKLLDFGIAKLLGDDEAMSMLTREGGVALTPKYAAPEQVTGGQITTATDVYTLGVLLFELLTGQHPTGLAAGSPIEFVKAITVGQDAAAVVGGRSARTCRLADRACRAAGHDAGSAAPPAARRPRDDRRQGAEEQSGRALRRPSPSSPKTCGASSMHQPIAARPDSLRYRAAKFTQRHWRPLAAGRGGARASSSPSSSSTRRVFRPSAIARATKPTKASRISALMTDLLSGADPYRTPDNTEPTVKSLLDRGAERSPASSATSPDLQTEMFAMIGRTYERMGRFDKALPLLEQAVATRTPRARPCATPGSRRASTTSACCTASWASRRRREPLLREAVAMRRQVLGPRHPDVAITLVELSRALAEQGRTPRPSRRPARRSTSARRSSATSIARRRRARATSGDPHAARRSRRRRAAAAREPRDDGPPCSVPPSEHGHGEGDAGAAARRQGGSRRRRGARP